MTSLIMRSHNLWNPDFAAGYNLRGISILGRSHFPSQVPIILQLNPPAEVYTGSILDGCNWYCTSVVNWTPKNCHLYTRHYLAILALEMNIGREWKCPFITLLLSLHIELASPTRWFLLLNYWWFMSFSSSHFLRAFPPGISIFS